MGRKNSWTAEDDQKLAELRDAGLSTDEIAAHMKRSRSAILSRACRLIQGGKLTSKNGDAWTAENDAELMRLRSSGLTMNEIVKATGRTFRAIQSRTHELLIDGRAPRLSVVEKTTRGDVVRARRTNRLSARATSLLEVPGSYTRDAGYVVGVLYGDGFINFKDGQSPITKSLGMSTTDLSFREAVVSAMETWVGEGRVKRAEHHVSAVIAPGGRVYHNVHYFDAWLYDRHFASAVNKLFGPTQTAIWSINVAETKRRGEEFCRGVIQGLVDSDGTVGQGSIRVGTISVPGVLSFVELLWAHGYDVKTHVREPKEARYQPYYIVSFSAEATRKYAREIGSRITYKQATLARYLPHNIRSIGES